MVSDDLIFKLKFKGQWRSYQERILNDLNYHLDDAKLNIVAAPGAGKTILGIEVMARLKNPAFILTPTITIKNQWKQRIIDNFLAENIDTNIISTDINNISPITVSTYQGLHSLYKDTENRKEFINKLKNSGINTLVLDEAHHLRTEWWATLNDLYKEMFNERFKLISLTGTPPYDVSPLEWKNYNSLCGTVDAEISIPELVKAGDLCPHQDLIYFSDLTEEENTVVSDFETRRDNFFKDINEHSDFLYAIQSSSFVSNLDNNVDIIYKDTIFTVALISYLLKEDSLSMEARILTNFLDLNIEQIPKFDYKQAEYLFEGIIGEFSGCFKNVPLIKNKLRSYHLINGKTVDFTGKINFKRLFARSKNKLKAIYDITEFEYNTLNNNLREVILLDYIGKGDSEGLNIISVFNNIENLKIPCGILTGTLVTIPKSSKAELYKILGEKNIDKTKVLTSDFSEEYLRVETYGNADIVSAITELFNKGYINILIGTAALLGEGWDSPGINTLIIASTVGSFMLSNQMRGRALRIDKNNKNKTSNIWHLVSVAKNEPSSDLITAEKRFNTFEGISYSENKIQNGIERLGIDIKSDCLPDIKALNEKIIQYAKERDILSEKWNQVFTKSAVTEKNMAPQVYNVALAGNTQQGIICSKIPNWCLGFQFLIKHCSISRKNPKINFFENSFLKLCRRFNFISENYADIINLNYQIYKRENTLNAFAKALLNTMYDLGIIKTDFSKIDLKINSELNSKFYITLTNCTNYERKIFVNSFDEIFNINDKNRYILKQNDKYVAVPENIASSNKNVKIFIRYLEKEYEYFDIIYTRNPKGYKELLKAKFNILDCGYLKQGRVWI